MPDFEVIEEQAEEQPPKPKMEDLQGRMKHQLQGFALVPEKGISDSSGFTFNDVDGNTCLMSYTIVRLNKGALIGGNEANHLGDIVLDSCPDDMKKAGEQARAGIAEFQKRMAQAMKSAEEAREVAEQEEHEHELERGN